MGGGVKWLKEVRLPRESLVLPLVLGSSRLYSHWCLDSGCLYSHWLLNKLQ